MKLTKMASTQRMWLSHHSMALVSVVMMICLCSTKAMPPQDCGADTGGSGGGTDFSSIITEKSSSGKARCVPFNKCCDGEDKGEKLPFHLLIDEKTGNRVIDIRSGSSNKCGEGLNVCCITCLIEDPSPITEPPTVTENTPQQWKCGKRNEGGFKVRVTGFEDGQTQQGEFPWMVALLETDTTFIGGGSLVQPRVVLTAGHKVYERSPDSLVVRIGDWDLMEQIESVPPQNIGVEKILYHPQYNRKYHNYSVAILILKSEATYGETVAPVCLPDPGQNFDGANCFVTGWGKDDLGDQGEYQKIMKMVSVPIVEHNQCQSQLRATKLGHEYVLPSSVTCAGGGKEDACTGDGGSPLVCPSVTNPQQLVQVGTVAWGIGCGIEGNPGVYGSVLASLDWITQTIQEETGVPVDRSIR